MLLQNAFKKFVNTTLVHTGTSTRGKQIPARTSTWTQGQDSWLELLNRVQTSLKQLRIQNPQSTKARDLIRRWALAKPAILEFQYGLITGFGCTEFWVDEDRQKFSTTVQYDDLYAFVSFMRKNYKFKSTSDDNEFFVRSSSKEVLVYYRVTARKNRTYRVDFSVTGYGESSNLGSESEDAFDRRSKKQSRYSHDISTFPDALL